MKPRNRAQASARPASRLATLFSARRRRHHRGGVRWLHGDSGRAGRGPRRPGRGAAKLHSRSPGAAARPWVGGLLPHPLGLGFMNGPGGESRAPCLLRSL